MSCIFDKNPSILSRLIYKRLLILIFSLLFVPPSQALESDSNLSFLTSTERQWLQDHPTINLAPDPEFLPIEFIDENGEYKGIAADYVRLIEKKLDVKFNILKFNNWTEVLEKTKTRENDMWGAATATPQRLKYMLFTKPLIKLPSVILVKKNVDKSLNSIESFMGMRVAAIEGYAINDYLTKQYPGLKIDTVPDIQTGLKKVSFGLVDAMAVNIALATYYIEKEGIANLRVAGEVGYINKWALASRSDWPMLNVILEKALAEISEAERKRIYRKWVGIKLESGFSLKQFLILFFSAVAVFGIIGIIVWNSSLKQQVQLRTIELNKKNEELNDANAAKSVFLANMSEP
jgi:ABC-type amino acid transport substrate-binding protein